MILSKAKIQADLFADELNCLTAGSDNQTFVDVKCLRKVFEHSMAHFLNFMAPKGSFLNYL